MQFHGPEGTLGKGGLRVGFPGPDDIADDDRRRNETDAFKPVGDRLLLRKHSIAQSAEGELRAIDGALLGGAIQHCGE
jgi:hypothetical protein